MNSFKMALKPESGLWNLETLTWPIPSLEECYFNEPVSPLLDWKFNGQQLLDNSAMSRLQPPLGEKINKLRSPNGGVCAYRKLKCHLMPGSYLFALPPDSRIPTYSTEVFQNLSGIYFLIRLQRRVALKYFPPGQVSEMNEQDECI